MRGESPCREANECDRRSDQTLEASSPVPDQHSLSGTATATYSCRTRSLLLFTLSEPSLFYYKRKIDKDRFYIRIEQEGVSGEEWEQAIA